MDTEPPLTTVGEPIAQPQPPRPLGAARAFLILTAFVLVQFAVAVVVAILITAYYVTAIPDPRQLSARVQAVAFVPGYLLGTAIGAAAALRLVRRSLPGPLASGALKPLGWVGAPRGVIIGTAGLGLLVALLIAYPITAYFPLHPGQSLGPLAQAGATPGLTRMGWAFVAIVVAPPVEEFLYRGVLLHGFSNTWNPRVAAIVVSVLFIAIHILETRSYWPALIGIALLAGATVAIRLVTKALGPAIAFHVGYNLALVGIVYVRAA